MTIRAGELRDPVDFVAPVATTSATSGEKVEAWTDVRRHAWAKIEPLAGSERQLAQQIRAEQTHVLTCRWFWGASETWRVAYRPRPQDATRWLKILSIIDVGERHVEMRVALEEVRT